MSDTTLSLSTPSRQGLTEDWVSLGIGLLVLVLALAGTAGPDLLGWVVTTSVWTDVTHALAPTAKSYAWLGGGASLLATYVALLAVLSVAAAALDADVKRFALAFTAIFWIAYAAWILGSYAHFAAVTPADYKKFGIDWSLRLTNEGGFVFALIAGLIIANFFPRFAEWLKDAVRPELYIKTAIVILGAFLAVTIAGRLSFASSIVLRGVAAIVEAYLIYWAVVYFVARKYFGFNREWAAPLASGISICGVAAAIATGGAIRARPVEIWQRFPKFIIGFVLSFAIGLYLTLTASPAALAKLTPAIAEANTFRVIFFILTFFSIGVLSNFRKLWEDGIGKLAAVYVVSLFGFVIWVGLLISWIFFAGVKPPLAG